MVLPLHRSIEVDDHEEQPGDGNPGEAIRLARQRPRLLGPDEGRDRDHRHASKEQQPDSEVRRDSDGLVVGKYSDRTEHHLHRDRPHRIDGCNWAIGPTCPAHNGQPGQPIAELVTRTVLPRTTRP
jgi:hypothetical protein